MRFLRSLLLVVALCSCPVSAAPPPTIMLMGEITSESAELFTKELALADAYGPTEIIINSVGGSVDAGWVVANAISKAHHPTRCVVDGNAHSMAFVVLQFCTTRAATDTSSLMYHEAFNSNLWRGITLLEAENVVAQLRVTNHTMAQFVCRRMGYDVAEFEKWIHGREWWLTGGEAKKAGVVDEVVRGRGAAL